VVSGPFDRLTYRRRCTAFGVQRAMVLSSIWLIIRVIRERIGIEGVANVCRRGHFGSVDTILEGIAVSRFEVASGAGGRFD